MRILSIESSCDETAAAVVEDGRKVLSSVVVSQVEEHKLYGGVVPEIASRRHAEAITGVVQEALEQANMTLKELDAVAVTYAPGLIGALLVGVNFAKGLSYAAGEVFDKVARTMGMPYPGGINLDKTAESGNDKAFVLPHPKVSGCEYDFSFSGLKTAAINIIHNAEQKGEAVNTADLSASFRKAVVDCLTENFLKAAKDYGYAKLVIAGGVSANSLLRRRLTEECERLGYRFYQPELKLCGDNAAMVGSQAYYEYLSGNTASLDLNAAATMSIEKG